VINTGDVAVDAIAPVVVSIVAGDPEGLAAAYDRYSGPLFGYCQSLLREPDDAADAPLRRWVGRHIDRCSVCSDRRRRELRPAALLSVAPGAVVGFALAGGGPGLQVMAPAGLRADVLHLATDHGARAIAYRAAANRGDAGLSLGG
jgi:hypothetical protein